MFVNRKKFAAETAADGHNEQDQTQHRKKFARDKWKNVSDAACGHKAKGITPPIAWGKQAWKEETLDDLP